MPVPVLWHFTFSHFAEKARWALDFKGVPHVRRALVPGLGLPRFRGHLRYAASAFSA